MAASWETAGQQSTRFDVPRKVLFLAQPRLKSIQQFSNADLAILTGLVPGDLLDFCQKELKKTSLELGYQSRLFAHFTKKSSRISCPPA